MRHSPDASHRDVIIAYVRMLKKPYSADADADGYAAFSASA
jgi:hypothetical protein